MNRNQRRAAKKVGGPKKHGSLAAVQGMFGDALRHHQAGRLAEAERLYRQILQLDARHVGSLHLLGIMAHQHGRHEAAVELIGQAIQLKGDVPFFHNDLAAALQAQGRLDEAVARYQRAVAIKPDYAEAHNNLGAALEAQGKLADAVTHYQRAVAIKPDYAEAHNNLGAALQDQGKLDDAVAHYQRAVAIKPDYAEAHSNLGAALQAQGKLADAVAHYQRALAIKPDFAEAHNNLGTAFQAQGKLDEALARHERALAIKPDYVDAHSTMLLGMNYHSGLSADAIHAEARRWNERHAVPCQPTGQAYANDREPNRRLRIGYVSPDFRSHSVAFFFEPLLRAHDRAVVEVFCYAEVRSPDAVTDRLRALAEHWQVTVGMTDEAMAKRIREDRIDILVDLAGHTGFNRLLVFSRKPAPVQATWLGYPNTTGLTAIDYRLVDAVTDPEGIADAWASEKLVRIKGGFLCYGPPADAPEPEPPPSLASGAITFGSFNNPAKLSAATLDVWAGLLLRLPKSRLLLKGAAFVDAATCAQFHTHFAARGVAPERIDLVARIPDNASHMAVYGQVDIALDPFPYNGATTTCEALWMGVPVVTLRGDRHAGRVGASLLGQLGLDDLTARTVEEYIEIAAALAGDRDRLIELRQNLRARMRASSLCDAPAFARKIEGAYREMWRRWRETIPADPGVSGDLHPLRQPPAMKQGNYASSQIPE